MNPTTFLTSFLVASGAFTFWCSARNYDWFFEFPGLSKTFIGIVGRPLARVFYLLISIPLFVWGMARVIDPPPFIPTEFIYEISLPDGIDLTLPTAVKKLNESDQKLIDLEVSNGDWNSFWIELDTSSPYFELASAASVAGPDFHEGFNFGSESIGAKSLRGVVLFFDTDYRSCNNVLFSDRPLNSAHFAMVICDPDTSRKNGFKEGLGIFFCRAGTSLYDSVIR